MKFQPELVQELVPKGMPPREFFQGTVFEGDNGEQLFIDLPVDIRGFFWASAMEQYYYFRNLDRRYLHISAGFVNVPEYIVSDLPSDLRKPFPFVFGVYVLVPGKEGQVSFDVVDMGEFRFPVIIHTGSIVYHNSIPHPVAGVSTCWVRNNGSHMPWRDGILTCRHIVNALNIGSPLTLIPTQRYHAPTGGVLADIDQPTIDAAVIEIDPTDFPRNVRRLKVMPVVGLGTEIEFESPTGVKKGYVLQTHFSRTYFGNLLGQRIITDIFGMEGDSGSLLQSVGIDPEGVGIYMAKIPGGDQDYYGLHQCLWQVEKYFHLELYI